MYDWLVNPDNDFVAIIKKKYQLKRQEGKKYQGFYENVNQDFIWTIGAFNDKKKKIKDLKF